jgi:endonuclease/exonuclease/phosphatase (EEP) superfamily protein YafD
MTDHPPPRPLRRVWRALPAGAAVVSLIGLMFHLGVRDSLPGLWLIYYLLPLPVLAALAALGAALALLQKRPALRVILPLAAVGFALWSYLALVRTAPPPTSHTGPKARVLFWNVARGAKPWPDIAREIRSHNADIITLVEVNGPNFDDLRFWQEAFPEYDIAPNRYSSLIMVRNGEILDLDHGRLAETSKHRIARLRVRGRDLTVMLVDIDSSVWLSRREAALTTTNQAMTLLHEPTLIVGDFNIPASSAYLDELRTKYRNVFESVGQGYQATWPVPLPLLSLDQAWTNRHLQPLTCHHGQTSNSDHRPVILDIALPEAKAITSQPAPAE